MNIQLNPFTAGRLAQQTVKPSISQREIRQANPRSLGFGHQDPQPVPTPPAVVDPAKPQPEGPATEANDSKRFFDQLALMKDVDPGTRTKIYKDLRTRHSGFWRNQMESVAQGIASMSNFTRRLPLQGLKLGSWLMNGYVPYSEKLYSPTDAQKLIESSKAKDVGRTSAIVTPFQKRVDPATLENMIDQTPFLQKMNTAFERYAFNGTITFSTFEKLFQKVSKDPGSFQSPEDLESAKSLVAAFPLLTQMSEVPDTLSKGTLAKFKQQVKDSIPFLYEQYGQNADLYVGANLFHLGIAKAMPDVGVIKKTGQAITDKLNESTTYRKVARWAKENQLSDTQFLPIYSFIDALYAQATAYGTGLVSEFSLGQVFSQMVALDGVFNGIGFFITKWQILLVGWEEEKPDRLRAQYDKQIRLFVKQKESLQNRLETEKQKMAEKIKANPTKAKEIEAEFEKTVLNPIMQETQKLMKGMDKFQLKLDKLLGVKKMGFFEKAWKKPPKLMNDLKLMVPISLAMTLPYEYWYFKKFTDYGMDFFSLQFLSFCTYMTVLSAGANIVLKQIIHVTQDKAKLYLYGKKDEMLSESNREMFAALKASINELSQSPNPKVKALAKELDGFYQQIAKPILGEEAQQNNNDKAHVRESKLSYSMAKTDVMKLMEKELDATATQFAKLPRRAPQRRALKSFQNQFKSLAKILDRAAYAKLSRTRSDFEILRKGYERELLQSGLEVFIPKQLSQFFKQTLDEAAKFYDKLDADYPTADLPFDPLPFTVKKDREHLRQAFQSALSASRFDPNLNTGWMGKLMRLGRAKAVPEGIAPGSIGDLLAQFAKNAKTKEERQALHLAASALGKVQKGAQRDLYVLEAKTKDQADQALADYQAHREQYAAETAQMPMGFTKVKRLGNQAGMAVNAAWKKATYLDKYNQWFTGYPWIPAHSLLNVAGRLGLTSIVQGHLLPASVMFKVWLFGQLPIRVWTFVNEKFLVMRDDFHRNRTAVERNMDHGMETYIKRLLAEKQKPQKAFGSPSEVGGESTLVPFEGPANSLESTT